MAVPLIPPVSLIVMPFSALATNPLPSIVIDLLIVIGVPALMKRPLSSTVIVPPTAVFEIARGHVLHGAFSEHGFTSSEVVPPTYVCAAWAIAAGAGRASTARTTTNAA